MCLGGGDSASGDSRALEEERKARINEGMGRIEETFAPFNAGYYNDFEGKYRDLAMPDINQQYRDATQKTRYGLARTGNLDSSGASIAYKDLATRNDQARLKAADDARAASAGQRQSIEGARNTLTTQLSATENPSAVAQAAVNQAAVLNRPPTYSPITNIFSEVTGALARNEQARQNGRPGFGFSINPWTQGSPSSVRTVS